jgi:hypothetical protein
MTRFGKPDVWTTFGSAGLAEFVSFSPQNSAVIRVKVSLASLPGPFNLRHAVA